MNKKSYTIMDFY
jgi:hypothetical protein